MTALPEGEHECSSNDQLIVDQNVPSHVVDNPGSQSHDDIPGDPLLLKFLEQYDLSDIAEPMRSSKLTLDHLCQVEQGDLEALCSDLNLSSSQKIRVKHAIKTLQQQKKGKHVHVESAEEASDRSLNGLRRRVFAKVEQIFGNEVAVEAEGSSKEEKVDDRVQSVHRLKSKIVIVGEAAVGKSTLQKAIMGWQFEEGSKATFAVNSLHHKSRFKHNDLYLVVDYEIFDTPGLDRFRDIITLYLRGALAVIVVYDVSTPSSFAKAKWWIEYLENHASGYDKIILIANKIDVEDEEDGKEMVPDPGSLLPGDSTAGKSDDCIITNGRMYATEHGIAFLEVSAKWKTNCEVLMKWIHKQSRMKVEQNPHLLVKGQSVNLQEPLLAGNTESGSKCC